MKARHRIIQHHSKISNTKPYYLKAYKDGKTIKKNQGNDYCKVNMAGTSRGQEGELGLHRERDILGNVGNVSFWVREWLHGW